MHRDRMHMPGDTSKMIGTDHQALEINVGTSRLELLLEHLVRYVLPKKSAGYDWGQAGRIVIAGGSSVMPGECYGHWRRDRRKGVGNDERWGPERSA